MITTTYVMGSSPFPSSIFVGGGRGAHVLWSGQRVLCSWGNQKPTHATPHFPPTIHTIPSNAAPHGSCCPVVPNPCGVDRADRQDPSETRRDPPASLRSNPCRHCRPQWPLPVRGLRDLYHRTSPGLWTLTPALPSSPLSPCSWAG
jgi:hypothetical protein